MEGCTDKENGKVRGLGVREVGRVLRSTVPCCSSLLMRAMSLFISRFDIKRTFNEIMRLGRKYGPLFLVYAVCLELLEDIVIPAFLLSIGKPQLVPVALAFHFEPIAYPLYFAFASILRRLK